MISVRIGFLYFPVSSARYRYCSPLLNIVANYNSSDRVYMTQWKTAFNGPVASKPPQNHILLTYWMLVDHGQNIDQGPGVNDGIERTVLAR